MAVWAFRTLRVIRPDIGIQLAATLAHCVLILARLVGFHKAETKLAAWGKVHRRRNSSALLPDCAARSDEAATVPSS